MSCHNAERWLREAIESILAQSFADFEFIIVDDGSADATSSILSGYAFLDPRVHVIRKASTGLADSLNVGIAQATGNWIARLDADDVALPHRLEKQLQIASSFDVVYVGSGGIEIDSSGRRMKEYSYPETHESLLENLIRGKSFPAHSSALIRTQALRQVGLYRPRIRRSQDWDLWLRLSEVGCLTSVQEPLVMIRKHAQQVSREFDGKDQIIFSRIAIASHFLRQFGVKDPVDLSEEIFQEFVDLVKNNLAREDVYDVYKLRALLRPAKGQSFFASENLFSALRFVARNPMVVFKLIENHYGGDNVGIATAKQWIRA